MSSDYRAEWVQPAWAVQEVGRERDGHRRHLPPHAYEQPLPRPHPSADDMASVLGIPADHVTPEILSAVVPMLAEIDRLHWQAEQFAHRQTWLERELDRHPVAACLNRRAFLRELDVFLVGAENTGSVALMQVAGIEALGQAQGLAAAEAAMRHIAAHMIGALRASDMVGCLGGSYFAVLLPGADEDQARIKMEAVVARMEASPFCWQGQPVTLVAGMGVHQLAAGESADRALAAADVNKTLARLRERV